MNVVYNILQQLLVILLSKENLAKIYTYYLYEKTVEKV